MKPPRSPRSRCASLLSATALGLWTGLTLGPHVLDDPQQESRHLTAESFTLVDAQGRTRAELCLDEHDLPRLTMWGANSPENWDGQITIGYEMGLPSVLLHSDVGQGQVRFGMEGSPGRPYVTMHDEAGTKRLEMAAQVKGGATVRTWDKDGAPQFKQK